MIKNNVQLLSVINLYSPNSVHEDLFKKALRLESFLRGNEVLKIDGQIQRYLEALALKILDRKDLEKIATLTLNDKVQKLHRRVPLDVNDHIWKLYNKWKDKKDAVMSGEETEMLCESLAEICSWYLQNNSQLQVKMVNKTPLAKEENMIDINSLTGPIAKKEEAPTCKPIAKKEEAATRKLISPEKEGDNFFFLESFSLPLYQDVLDLEKIIFINYRAVPIIARACVEYLVKKICNPKDAAKQLSEIMSTLRKKVPDGVLAKMHDIRKKGNDAVHHLEIKVTEKEAFEAHRDLFDILVWYAKEHSYMDFKKPIYKKPVNPEEKSLSNQELKNIEVKIIRSITNILDESDLIAELIEGGKAGIAQTQIINNDHPIIFVKGGAGTGKSLCILAKALKQIKKKYVTASGIPLHPQIEPRALIISHSKTLSSYLMQAVKKFDYAKNLTITACDGYLHALAAKRGLKGKIISTSTREQYIKEVIINLVKTYDDNPFYQINDEIRLLFLDEEFKTIELQQLDKDTYLTMSRKHLKNNRYILPIGSPEREIIWQIYQGLKDKMDQENEFLTNSVFVQKLQSITDLPVFDCICIDEGQDLTVESIKLFSAMLRDESSQLMIVGDEKQKIFKGDFNWAQLGQIFPSARVVYLAENYRNNGEISLFLNYLEDTKAKVIEDLAATANRSVSIAQQSMQNIQESLRKNYQNKSTLILISDYDGPEVESFTNFFSRHKLPYGNIRGRHKFTGIQKNKIYFSSWRNIKGLEFDQIIIPSMNHDSQYYGEDEEIARYYMIFSRARSELKIYYQTTPHQLLLAKFRDYIDE